jgi:hypothetical protein
MSRSKQKGTSWETAVVRYLQRFSQTVERRALHGGRDLGDVTGIPGVVIEAKNEKAITLAAYVDEAIAEGDNANADVAVAWIHRRGKSSPADGYVVMNGTQFVSLLIDAGYLPRTDTSQENSA